MCLVLVFSILIHLSECVMMGLVEVALYYIRVWLEKACFSVGKLLVAASADLAVKYDQTVTMWLRFRLPPCSTEKEKQRLNEDRVAALCS